MVWSGKHLTGKHKKLLHLKKYFKNLFLFKIFDAFHNATDA